MTRLGTTTFAVFVLTTLVACAASPTPTPISTPEPGTVVDVASPTPAPIIPPELGTVVDEGGFSFRAPIGFGAEVEASRATIISDDKEIKILLTGKSVCDIKSLEGLTNGFLGELARGFLELEYRHVRDFEAGKSYPVVIGTTEGLAADVVGWEWASGYKITGRAAMAAPSNSQLFFALAITKAHRWATEGEEAFNVILNSITFFEPMNPSSFIPCFIHHTPPELTVDFGAFTGADLTDLGCHTIRRPPDLFGGLEPSYPIAECDAHDTEDGYLYFVGGRTGSFGFYVIFRDGEFVPIRTKEAFRDIFAPVETAEEALSYVLALTYRDRSPRAHYDFELNPSYSYFVDTIEDTHVERVEDGYIVHLFDYENRICAAAGRDWVQTFAVDLHVTFEGNIYQVSSAPVYQLPSPCLY